MKKLLLHPKKKQTELDRSMPLTNQMVPKKRQTSQQMNNNKLNGYLNNVRQRPEVIPKQQQPPMPPLKQPLQKGGLLGGVQEYENMTKEQVMEKLMVAEQLLKKLYKENMQLKEQLQDKHQNKILYD